MLIDDEVELFALQSPVGSEDRETKILSEMQESVLGQETPIAPRSFVYFASDQHGHVKIGYSTNPGARVQQLMNGTTLNPTPHAQITLLAKSPGTFDTETKLHRVFSPFRVSGTKEWYFSNTSLCFLIRSIAGYIEPPEPVSELTMDLIEAAFMSVDLSRVEDNEYIGNLKTIPDAAFNSEAGRRRSVKANVPRGGTRAGAGRPRSCECGACAVCKRWEKRKTKLKIIQLTY